MIHGAANTASLFATVRPLLVALGDESRQAIMVALLDASEPLNVGAIAARVSLSQPAASHHLKLLKDAGVLVVLRRGQQRLYSPTTGPVYEPIKDLLAAIDACLPHPTGPEEQA